MLNIFLYTCAIPFAACRCFANQLGTFCWHFQIMQFHMGRTHAKAYIYKIDDTSEQMFMFRFKKMPHERERDPNCMELQCILHIRFIYLVSFSMKNILQKYSGHLIWISEWKSEFSHFSSHVVCTHAHAL